MQKISWNKNPSSKAAAETPDTVLYISLPLCVLTNRKRADFFDEKSMRDHGKFNGQKCARTLHARGDEKVIEYRNKKNQEENGIMDRKIRNLKYRNEEL